MANFQCTWSKSVSNCQTLTVTDTSNYGDNAQFYTKDMFYIRTVTIKNIFGTTLSTKSIPTTTDSIDFDISDLLSFSPLYLNIILEISGTPGLAYTTGIGNYLPCIL